MRRINFLRGPALTLITMLIAVFAVAGLPEEQTEKDPHRPPCTSAHCRKIKSYLKTHYCGESPAGNGPDDGCDLRDQKKPGTGVNVKADVKCEWNANNVSECKQRGQPSPDIRGVLISHLRKLGLPAKANGKTYFTVWESTQEGWSVAEADYSNSFGSDIELCEVIVLVTKSSQVLVLRRVPFQKTDSDVPTVTQWSLLDLADADGDGQVEIILQGDAYENHWLEVVAMRNGSPKTIFSGLGYYL